MEALIKTSLPLIIHSFVHNEQAFAYFEAFAFTAIRANGVHSKMFPLIIQSFA